MIPAIWEAAAAAAAAAAPRPVQTSMGVPIPTLPPQPTSPPKPAWVDNFTLTPTRTPISSGGGTPAPPPPPPKPINPWITTSNYVAPQGVLQADPDIVITAGEDPISPELLLQLEYENVSGMELINISRSDMIDGQEVIYSPIKNLSSLRRKYNPNNIIGVSSLASSSFSKYAIDLILRIGEDPETGLSYEPYFNDNGDLVIELQDVRDDEIVEVDIDTSGTINLVEFL